MNRQKFGGFIKNFIQNKVYQFLIAFFISASIIYGTWHYAIQEMYVKQTSLEKKIRATNLEELKSEIKNLRAQNKELVESYKKEQERFKELKVGMHKTHYPIIVDILDKINSYSFNIHNYRLSGDMKRIDISMVGSYQNLIRFIDFLGNIPAEVVVKDYIIRLSQNNMMIIKLGIEVAPIRI